MAKLLVKVTRRPVGWPASLQLPVSSSTVWNMPSSVTSPLTPLISTQSPRRMPFLPISASQPKKATMKSFSATVNPAPTIPIMVPNWLGMPMRMSRMMTAALCPFIDEQHCQQNSQHDRRVEHARRHQQHGEQCRGDFLGHGACQL